jgi:HAD superfamily hydrolase (TIGR01459 family)
MTAPSPTRAPATGPAVHRDLAGLVVLLSNSSRPAEEIEAMLAGMGIGRALFTAAVTSGEACKVAMERMEHPALAGLPRRCVYIGDAYDLDWIGRIGVEVVDRVEEAAFVLLTSIEEFTHPLDHYRPTLEAAARRGLPLLCANPDRRVVVSGAHRMGSGTLADAYEGLGGRLVWFGKPYAEVYRLAAEIFARAGVGRPLAIGDALETDVAGALAAGIPAALIPGGGVHRAELGIGFGEMPAPDRLEALFADHGARPDHLLAAFRFD